MARSSRSYQRRQERCATIGRKEAGLSACGYAILADCSWQCGHGVPVALTTFGGDAASLHSAVKER